MKIELCDLCGSERLIPAHTPEDSVRRLIVYVCERCSLVQSLPRVDRVDTRTVSVTSGAAWGNVRYGKSFRVDATFDMLGRTIDASAVTRCLDVGSSRGAFVTALRAKAPSADILAVEPDTTIVGDYAGARDIRLITSRIEDVQLPDAHFDLIHCSHTLEHVSSPRRVLAQLRRALAPGGHLMIEVPSLAFIEESDVVEEWFLDKHLYHFSRATLERYLRTAGLGVVEGTLRDDIENLALMAVPTTSAIGEAGGDPGELRVTLAAIAQYQHTVASNRIKLRRAVAALRRLDRTRVVVWGAGRLFDSLVRFGGMDPGRLTAVVDTYLGKYVETVHGRPIVEPRRLPALEPDLIVIASRAYEEEICRQIHALLPGCATVGFGDLLDVPVDVAIERT